MKKMFFAAACMLGIVSATPLLAHAEGSKDLIRNGGYRPYLEWDSSKTSNIVRQNVMKVYAKEGETIDLGSSVTDAPSNQDIVVRAPNGDTISIDVTTAGTGNIDTLAKEANGPFPAKGGYKPYTITVGPEQEGIWEVEFRASKSPTQQDPPPITTITNFATDGKQAKTVAAWDITVVDAQNNPLTGRVFSNYLALNMGSNNVQLNSDVYILTKDGYQYKTEMNGMDPYGFIFFANNRGYVNAYDNSTLYHSIPLGTEGVNVQNPRVADSGVDITHRVFINPPSSDLPFQTTAQTPPKADDIAFSGNQTGNITTEGAGGTFTFTTTRTGSYQIIIDTNGPGNAPDGMFNPKEDVVLENVATPGSNTVTWNGKYADGTVVPALANKAPYQYQISLKGGEYHFPMLDVENNPSGFKITLQNPPGSYPAGMNSSTVYYSNCRLKAHGFNRGMKDGFARTSLHGMGRANT
ncbi:hypothetical protein ACTID9_03715 [Brevibacillus fluminis]|uniref:hypothetical protein n=1 Tax=Brevibacillus fluminis TaxID=511487 RepID=UPI003F88CA4A